MSARLKHHSYLEIVNALPKGREAPGPYRVPSWRAEVGPFDPLEERGSHANDHGIDEAEDEADVAPIANASRLPITALKNSTGIAARA